MDAPVILDVEEEGVIYEGSFTEADEDWIQDMVNEIHDGEEEETDAEAEIVDPIPEEVAEPEEESVEEPEAVVAEEPGEEPEAVIAEEPVEEPEAVVAEEPVEEPEEVIVEEPIEEPVEQPAEELIEENLPEVDGDDPDSLLGALKGMFGVEEATAENDDAAPWEEDAHVSVRAEEVDSLMSDAEVKEYQKTATVPTTRSAGTKKAQINLDTISAAYAEGDTVTLNSLKEKKLIGKNAGAVKILARGTLNKSLIVIAQDFSMAAVKMILLTGGQAIVTKPSGEQTER